MLPLSRIEAKDADAQMFRKIGVITPLTRPEIGEVMHRQRRASVPACARATWCWPVGTTPIVDGQQLREIDPRHRSMAARRARRPGRSNAAARRWRIEVTPELRDERSGKIGRIGAYVGAPPEMVMVRQGLVDGVWRRASYRTWEVSALTLRMMGRMVIGEASLKNLSGPLTIADYAGKSASLGLTQYMVFLALISVSLGVLNLLPLPVLDGGHLMYYLWEGLTGKSVSDAWMERCSAAALRCCWS